MTPTPPRPRARTRLGPRFDECHKAKNFAQAKEEGDEAKAKDASSKTALAVVNLQRMMPKARVVYCSATGV